MPTLFDAHSHLPRPGAQASRHHRVVCGTSEADWDAVLAHAASDVGVIPMLGLHPWHVEEALPDWSVRLEDVLRSHRVGVGECGLDFARRDTDHTVQEAAFRLQLRLARELQRPLAIHTVRAWGPLVDLLKQEGAPAAGAMVHGFSGSPETARILQGMGVFLSFSGDLLRSDRAKLRESLLAVKPTHLLLESDGAENLLKVVEGAAALLGMSVEDLAGQTWENGQRCFQRLLA